MSEGGGKRGCGRELPVREVLGDGGVREEGVKEGLREEVNK